MSLSDKFTEERAKINREIDDERVKAHCHTTINKIEDDVRGFIKALKDSLADEMRSKIDDDRSLEQINLGNFNFVQKEIDKLAGEKLT